MKPIEKIEAEERKMQMYMKALNTCQVCGKHISYSEAQLAHRIPKGYAKTFSDEIIHHELNMVITCAKCNSSVLLSPAAHPVEVGLLIDRIKEDLEHE